MARVLIADDDGSLRFLLSRVLADAGHDVVACADGAQAFARLTVEPQAFDVLITDWSMPRMDGEELVRRVHARAGTLRVAVMSATERCAWPLDLPLDAFFAKPFDLGELRAFAAGSSARAPAAA